MSRILHIAPFNTANVPYSFVQAERKLGHFSQLITLGKHRYDLPEDICLNLPFLQTLGLNYLKNVISSSDRLVVDNVHRIPESIPKVWQPNGWLEEKFIQFRERIWKSKINALLNEMDVESFDVFQLDGGLEFYRNGRIVQKLKQKEKKIICCYTGSDLRVRGVIPEIDELSDLNVTVEYDHLLFHPNIHHVFFPFDADHFQLKEKNNCDTLRIGHAPTNRLAKGSDQIIAELEKLKLSHSIEIVLIENLPYEEALRIKATCDIFIDQIGDLGYGINSLEAFAIGIPVASSLVEGFSSTNPNHPFIEIDAHSIATKLIPILEDFDLRKKLGEKGREWVQKYHDPVKVVQKIHQLAGIPEIESKKMEKK